MACVQAVAQYGRELWWGPGDAGRRDDIQLLLNRGARSILGALPTTPQVALMRHSGLTPTPVILESRLQHFSVRLADACSNQPRRLNKYPSAGTPVARAVRQANEHGQTAERMSWPDPGEGSVVRTIILDDTTAAKKAAQRWEKEEDAKVGAGVWMWWTDGLCSDNGRVGAAAVRKHRDERRSHCSCLSTGQMEIFDAKLCMMGLALKVTIKNRETLQRHAVRTMAVFSDSQAAIRCTTHLAPGHE